MATTFKRFALGLMTVLAVAVATAPARADHPTCRVRRSLFRVISGILTRCKER